MTLPIFDEEHSQQAENTVAHMRQALGRVRHPLYHYLITSLVDAVTLQLAAVEQAVDARNDDIAPPTKRGTC